MDGASAAQSAARGDGTVSCGLKLMQVDKSRHAALHIRATSKRLSAANAAVFVSQPQLKL